MEGVGVDVPMCMEWDRMDIYVYDGCVRMWMNVESSWGAQELACCPLLLVFVCCCCCCCWCCSCCWWILIVVVVVCVRSRCSF